jgi:hypothetical protein
LNIRVLKVSNIEKVLVERNFEAGALSSINNEGGVGRGKPKRMRN